MEREQLQVEGSNCRWRGAMTGGREQLQVEGGDHTGGEGLYQVKGNDHRWR